MTNDTPPTKPNNSRVVKVLVLAVVGALLSAAALAYLQIRVPQLKAEEQLAAAELAGAAQVAGLNKAISQLQNQVTHFAQREDVIAALTTAAAQRQITGTAELESIQRDSLALFEDADALIFMPLSERGTIDPYNDLLARLTAIEIDLVSRCTDQTTTSVEAQRMGKLWIMSTVSCTSGGAIVLRTPLTSLAATLAQLAAGKTHSMLLQRFGKKGPMIARSALAEYSDQSAELQLVVPHWVLSVSVKAEGAASKTTAQNRLIAAFAAFSLSGLTLFGAAGLLWFRRRAALADAAFADRKPGATGRSGKRKKSTTDAAKTESDIETAAELPAAGDDSFAAAVAANTGSHAAKEEKPKETKDEEIVLDALPEGAGDLSSPFDALVGSEIFRAYDIRGIADSDMDNEFCINAGRAFGSVLAERGDNTLILGRDGRLSSPRIHQYFTEGLLSTGCQITDLGIVPTPMAHFASFIIGIGNVAVITGSHNAAEYNGIKMSVDFSPLSADEIKGLYLRINESAFAEGSGGVTESDIRQQYIDYICKDISLKDGIKVVIDAGNGATSEVGPHLFRALGCEVIPINCELDGNFPAHPPDPTIAINLHKLSAVVAEKNADLGIAFDGDGDRVVAVTSRGDIIRSDALLMLLARDVCRRNPGAKVVYDVKCSTLLKDVITEHGGVPVIWKSGHSHMKLKMAETEGLVGGELSGHIFYRERWFGFDDGMYAAARLMEIISKEDIALHKLTAALPRWESTPEILIPVSEHKKFSIVARAIASANFEQAEVIDIDGIRVEYDDRWGLLRASNTGPAISLRFEGSDKSALNQIRDEFIELLEDIEPAVALALTEH